MSEQHYGLPPKTKTAAPAAGKDVFSTPPAAKPALTGNMPLPPGEIVKPTHGYTEEELKTLNTIPGWHPSKGVPSNLPDLLAQARAAQAEFAPDLDPANIPPPVPLDTPPLEVPPPVDINQLPPEERDRILQGFAEAEQYTARKASDESRLVKNLSPGATGVNEALSGASIRNIDLTDDTQDEHYAGTDIPKQAPPPQSSTGATAPIVTECEHCHWKHGVPDIPDPEPIERQRYLQSMAGGPPFEKLYPIFDGSMSVLFRELTPREVDLVYKQAHLLRRAGKVDSYEDFFEMLSRYRLCLQLVELQMPDIVHRFPRTVEAWAGENQVETADTTCLPDIAEQLYGRVIRSESLNRVLGAELSRFNRLVAKLEVNAHNRNFWLQTGPAS